MNSLVIIILLGLSALLLYKKRFTSEKRFGGLFLLHWYYLILSVAIPAFLINLGLDIIARPAIPTIAVRDNLIFSSYMMAVITAAMGAAIHSSSTSVYEAFVSRKNGRPELLRITHSQPYKLNEVFHGFLSHHLLFQGVIFGSLLLALLELNHPYSGTQISQILLMSGAILIGLIEAIAILWSTYSINWITYIGTNLLSALIAATTLLFIKNPFMADQPQFPLTVVVIINMLTVSVCLISFSSIFIISDRMTRRFIKRIFPKSHDFYKSPTIKFLKYKIEREWL